jgi:hypothetical protein
LIELQRVEVGSSPVRDSLRALIVYETNEGRAKQRESACERS